MIALDSAFNKSLSVCAQGRAAPDSAIAPALRAESSASLTRCGDELVPVYNDVRPHCSLEGLTPSEVLAGMRPDNPDHLKSVNLRADKPVKLLKPEIKCTECSE